MSVMSGGLLISTLNDIIYLTTTTTTKKID